MRERSGTKGDEREAEYGHMVGQPIQARILRGILAAPGGLDTGSSKPGSRPAVPPEKSAKPGMVWANFSGG